MQHLNKLLLILILSSSAHAQYAKSSEDKLMDYIKNYPQLIAEATKSPTADVCYTAHGLETSPLKDWDQLSRYFDCYKRKELSKQQIDILKVSADHYKVSNVMLSCLLLIESRFDSSAKSAYAKGIAQFTPATMRNLKRLNSRPDQDVIDRCKSVDATSKSYSYCRTIGMRVRNQKSLQKLLKKLSMNKLHSERLNYDALDGHSSIVLSAMYISSLKEVITIKAENLVNSNQNYNNGMPRLESGESYYSKMDVRKMALAAYNMGPTYIDRFLAEATDETTMKDTLNSIRNRSTESTGHMDGIERCMTKDDFSAPTKSERKQMKADKVQC